MPRRPCLDCGALTPPGRSRCPTHERAQARRRQRPGSTALGYGYAYRQARAALLADGPPCHWACGRAATTADHWPPRQVAGPHLHLLPACSPCNSGHAAQRAWDALTDAQRTAVLARVLSL